MFQGYTWLQFWPELGSGQMTLVVSVSWGIGQKHLGLVWAYQQSAWDHMQWQNYDGVYLPHPCSLSETAILEMLKSRQRWVDAEGWSTTLTESIFWAMLSKIAILSVSGRYRLWRWKQWIVSLLSWNTCRVEKDLHKLKPSCRENHSWCIQQVWA